MSGMYPPELARKLEAGDVGGLFRYSQRRETLARVWEEGREALEALAKDPDAPERARFLAAEVLFAHDPRLAAGLGMPLIAALYASALAKGYVQPANAWGLLWESDDVGQAGARFLALGPAAIPALTALLDDATIVDTYEGSEEATIGNRAGFRVKDFAAYYLGRITRHRVPFHREHAKRDREIARLQQFLSTWTEA